MKILKGKPVAEEIEAQIIKKVDNLLQQNIVPTLGILRVGSSKSDVAYENSAVKKANSLGIHVEKYIMDEESTESDVLDVLRVMNEDSNIHGIMIFRPLPPSMDEDRIRNHIAPQKDIDGISDRAVSGLFTGESTGFPPCTAEAALAMLEYYGIETEGRRAAVIGRSLVVGKPAAMMLLNKNATVTLCHSRTNEEDMREICRGSDIIICAAGKLKALGREHVSGSQTVIDVGINFDSEGMMCGDVDFEAVKDNAGAVTPVPGGVGSVTTAILMYHVAEAAMRAL